MDKKFLITGGTGFIGQRVVCQLVKKNIPVIASDVILGDESKKLLNRIVNSGLDPNLLKIKELDIYNQNKIDQIIVQNGITHIICCGYQMSNMIDADPILGSKINIVGMTNIFESTAKNKIQRLVFPSSESVYGTSQKIYGNRPVKEDDYCGLQHHQFTYAVMKLLNEFMAQKYVKAHGISIACTRPSVVFGYGRKRSSLMWAEDFATLPALGKPVHLPFPEDNKDNWIYVDDCAEQMILLSLKDKINHFVYNTGSETVSGKELASIIKQIIPDAQISFNNNAAYTPFIDDQDDTRIREELSFKPRTLKLGILEHMNEARKANNLKEL
jgi:nucleoside-diphosphate-sugar epimerase